MTHLGNCNHHLELHHQAEQNVSCFVSTDSSMNESDTWISSDSTHFACAANNLSAVVPCLSPLPSFLNAYCTVICLPPKNCPFMFSMAISEVSKSWYETNP